MHKEEIKKLVKKYERQLERCKKRESELEEKKENLSVHGYWSMGYFGSRVSLYEDIIDDLRELLE